MMAVALRCLCLILPGLMVGSASAQQTSSDISRTAPPIVPSTANAVTEAPTSKIIINGTVQTDQDVRRQSTASKIVVGREELDRDGDSSIGEILKLS